MASTPFLSRPVHDGRAPAPLPAGTRLDRFIIIRRLGSGSLGDVYLATDELRGHDLAIKVVDVGPCEPVGLAERLHSERSAYDRVHDHRHVLKVYDVHAVSLGGTELLVLSMEYAEGGTFRQWLRGHRGNCEVRQTRGLERFLEICRGAAACHQAGVAHLDIKPENVLVVNGVLKLSDFSIATVIRNLTMTGTAVGRSSAANAGFGTPAYMSPEHFTASCPDDLDPRADVYSLGVVLYEILHPKCRPPFGGSYVRLRDLHLGAPLPELPGADETVRRIVRRCLDKDPAQRYGTAQELLEDLEGPSLVEDESTPDGSEGLARDWELTLELLGEGRLAEAGRVCGRILHACPEHADAAALLDQIEERSGQARELYGAIAAGLESLPLEELCALLAEAVETYPEHPAGRAVQIRLEHRSRQYRQAMEEALTSIRRRDWDSSVSWFRTARDLNAGAPDAERPVRFAEEVVRQVRETRQAIDVAIEAGHRTQAMALARGLDEYLDEVSQLVPRTGGGNPDACARD